MTEGAAGGSAGDCLALYDLFAAYGALIDAAEFDAWLALFAATCTYQVVPRENYERELPAGLVYCDSRAMLEDRIRALREANKYNIHTDRHLIGLPRLTAEEGDAKLVQAPFLCTRPIRRAKLDYSRPASTAIGSWSRQVTSNSATSWYCSTPLRCRAYLPRRYKLPELVCVLRRTGCA